MRGEERRVDWMLREGKGKGKGNFGEERKEGMGRGAKEGREGKT